MSEITIILLVVVGLPLAVGLVIVVLYNRLVSLKNQVEAAWSQIDVQLRRRTDLIPNLVEVVKDYLSYEQETLTRVIEARNHAVAARDQGREATIAAEGMLTAAMGKLFALAESYPELRSNQNVAALQEELATTENKIAFARQHYNDSAMSLNTAVETFPSNLVATRFGFRKSVYFEVPEEARQPVKVDLR
ncbi:MAG: LemA family protein [Kiloniellaceae bacterium]